MIYYIDVMPDGKVRAGLQYDAPDVGPAPDLAEQTIGTLVQVPAPVSWSGPTETSVLYWKDGAYLWLEEGQMEALIVAAVAKCYTDIDAVYADAIGNRAVEYTDAEIDARAFIAGAPVTENVSSYAVSNPTGQTQTNQWAAEQIVARADAFKTAQIAMRARRFETQAALRACVTPADLAHAVYLWDQFITGLRTQLDL